MRTRLAAQTGARYYHGIAHALRTIVREEGARGLYSGLGATLLQARAPGGAPERAPPGSGVPPARARLHRNSGGRVWRAHAQQTRRGLCEARASWAAASAAAPLRTSSRAARCRQSPNPILYPTLLHGAAGDAEPGDQLHRVRHAAQHLVPAARRA